jgi:hypothetical protein
MGVMEEWNQEGGGNSNHHYNAAEDEGGPKQHSLEAI